MVNLDIIIGLKPVNKREKIRGLEVGLFNKSKYVAGCQIGGINSAEENVLGTQIGIINGAQNTYGLQIGLAQGTGDTHDGYHYGAQLGFFNAANFYGAQIGVLNLSETGKGIQAGFLNTSCLEDVCVGWKGDYSGHQLGFLNVCLNIKGVQTGVINSAKTNHGVQAGLLNLCLKELKGFQIAPICYAKDGQFCQIGLLTIRGTGSWYSRISPLIGWKKKPKSEGEKQEESKQQEKK